MRAGLPLSRTRRRAPASLLVPGSRLPADGAGARRRAACLRGGSGRPCGACASRSRTAGRSPGCGSRPRGAGSSSRRAHGAGSPSRARSSSTSASRTSPGRPLRWSAGRFARRRRTGTEFSADDWYEWGCELEPGSPAEASRAYARALALDPDARRRPREPRAAASRGGRRRRRPSRTIAAALALRPDDATAAFNLGVALEDLRRLPEALLAYQQAVRLDPDERRRALQRGRAGRAPRAGRPRRCGTCGRIAGSRGKTDARVGMRVREAEFSGRSDDFSPRASPRPRRPPRPRPCRRAACRVVPDLLRAVVRCGHGPGARAGALLRLRRHARSAGPGHARGHRFDSRAHRGRRRRPFRAGRHPRRLPRVSGGPNGDAKPHWPSRSLCPAPLTRASFRLATAGPRPANGERECRFESRWLSFSVSASSCAPARRKATALRPPIR